MNNHNKIYSKCDKKIKARLETIIQPYKFIFKQSSLPPDKQYWTLCAKVIDKNGNIIPDTELDQIIKANLIQSNQFIGVDLNKEVIKHNSKYTQATWYNKDIVSAMNQHFCDNKHFDPAIVNCDFIGTPDTQSKPFSKVIDFLTDRNISNVMVVGNFVLQTQYIKDYSSQDIIENLFEIGSFKESFSKNWEFINKSYIYDGTGNKSSTKMATIILYRK